MALELDWSKCEGKEYAPALGHYMMFTGLGWELKEHNVEDFYCRIQLHIALNGPIYYIENKPVDWTPEIVRSCIGLKANVGGETWRQFVKRMTDFNQSESQRTYKKYMTEVEMI